MTEISKVRFIWNLTLDDAGTYYCAVTSCGHTMFANGTTIKIRSKTCMFCISKSNIPKLM